MSTESSGWIWVTPGVRFSLLDPRPEVISIESIAVALSRQARFAGHTRQEFEFGYSVAQHSVAVSMHCDPLDALWGLLHDASEAYLVDVPRPIKHLPEFQAYRAYETQVMAAVCARFRLPLKEPASVKRSDEEAVVTEARDLLDHPLPPDWQHTVGNGFAVWPETIIPLPSKAAEALFLARYKELTQ